MPKIIPQTVSGDIPTIVKRKYEEDQSISQEFFPQALVHKGEPVLFKLSPSFLDSIAIQDLENFYHLELGFLTENEQKNISEIVDECEKAKMFRRAIRQRYPLKVWLKPGVLYCPINKVICKGKGDIDFLLQEKLEATKIFKHPEQVSRRVTQVEKARDESHAQLIDDDTQFINFVQENVLHRSSSPLPGPSDSRKRSAEDQMNNDGKEKVVKKEDELNNTKKLVFPFYDGKVLGVYGEMKTSTEDPFQNMKIASIVSQGRRFYRESSNFQRYGSVVVGTSLWQPDATEGGKVPNPISWVNIFKSRNALKGSCININLKEAQMLMVMLGKAINDGVKLTAESQMKSGMSRAEQIKAQGNEDQADLVEAYTLEAYESRNEEMEKRKEIIFNI